MCSLSARFAPAYKAFLPLLRANFRYAIVVVLSLVALLSIQTIHAQSIDQTIRDVEIIGGEAAEAGAYPWMVGIVESDREDPFWAQYCGGTLIHPQWVLTAAHCTYESGQQVGPEDIEVLIGRSTLRGTDGERAAIQQIIRHPQYNTGNGNADIALVRLATPSDIPVVKMADRSMINVDKSGVLGTILGWGRTTTNIRINTLQQAQVPLVSAAVCALAYRELGYTLTENMLCAGFQAGGTDACSGDSGGPLLIREDQNDDGSPWVQAGIISWGKGCAQPDAYGVYAHVARFKDWVDVQIALNSVVVTSGTTTLPPSGQSIEISHRFMPFIGN